MDLLLVGTGRMGTMVRRLMEEDGGFRLLEGVHRANLSHLSVAGRADAVIDFSHRDLLPEVAAYVRRTGSPLVSGTTGYTEQQMELLRALGEAAPVIHSANFSVGVAVLKRLAALAAAGLPDFDIEIVETHHNQKADAPSGTARLLLQAVDPEGAHTPVYGREGMTGRRDPREIGVHAVRGGSVAGEHTVALFGQGEELRLTHRADSRSIFAAGALRAARALAGRQPGFYTLEDLLFGKES